MVYPKVLFPPNSIIKAQPSHSLRTAAELPFVAYEAHGLHLSSRRCRAVPST